MSETERLIDAILKDERDELKDVSVSKLNQLSDKIWMLCMDERQKKEVAMTQKQWEAHLNDVFFGPLDDEFLCKPKGE